MAGHPNEALMRQYGNQHIFEKKGDGASYLARMAYGAALAEHSRQAQELAAERHEHALRVSEALRDMRTARVLGLVEAAKHTRMPVILRAEPVPGADTDGGLSGIPGTAIPLGFDDGMVRIASAIGADLAQMEKDAGFVQNVQNLAAPIKQVAQRVTTAVKNTAQPVMGKLKAAVTPGPGAAGKRLLEAESKLPSSVGQAPIPSAPKTDMLGQKVIDRSPAAVQKSGPGLFDTKGTQQFNPLMGPERAAQKLPTPPPTPQAAPITPPVQPGAPAASAAAAPPPPPQPAATPAASSPGQLAPAGGAPTAPVGQLAPAGAAPKAAVTGTNNPVTQHADGTFHETLPGGGTKVHQTDPNAATITHTTQGDAAAAGKPGALDRLKGMSGGEWASNLKRMAVMGGLAYGGYKLLNKGMDLMGQEPSAPATYGSNAPGLAYGVNQYGQPQY